ncbi:hypothetical protein [Flaviaesturariibacter aridisoli]|uniref:Beta-lactamase-inhibitor-like PepSY-like domain-containing protein n=1 Tax=Flaviaesturariibacter aridisoli TaxID=2545761 RepID=A0A4R4DWS5_9BACT|nr:hypothetical protein [Flaviaesturariibacter aridisoli]TCZ67082.1 hypothetical protein E0486_16215 [Flaviaesturariibacter aridisoli]
MKFLFILLASFSTLISNAGTTVDVTPAVLESFQTTFGNAKEVSWNSSNELFAARFTLDGQHINAYYTAEGGLVALTRNVTVSQLPVMLQTSLKRQHNGAWISELFEYATDEGTFYYATLENADMKITLRSSNNNEWSTYKQIEKI